MGFRVVTSGFQQTPKSKPKKEAGYLAFIRGLPCCVTGTYGVEAAHLSYAATEFGHYGRGKQSKASDRWALPLSSDQHRAQHSMSEREYWERAGINPHILALVLHGLWTEHGPAAEPFAVAVINQRIFGRAGQ